MNGIQNFLSLINEDNKVNEDDKKDDDKIKVEKPSFVDKTFEIVKDYSIPFVIVVVVSGLTISFYSVIIRKIKHGL